MYLRVNERFGEYSPEPIGPVGLAPAIAIEAGAAATVVAIIEAILFVLSAAAAAYLLIKAYEAAQARGFGLELAKRVLTAGLRPMINMGKRIAELARRFLQQAARWAQNRPDCQRLLFEAMRAVADLERTLAEIEAELGAVTPRGHELRRLLTEITQRALNAKNLWQQFKGLCGPALI